jgi:hypothetical protein
MTDRRTNVVHIRMQLSVQPLRFETQKVGATNIKLVPIVILLSERIMEATLQWKTD